METDREVYERKADENLLALTQKNENNLTKNNLMFLIFSSLMLTGVLVCLICDAALAHRITWSAIPVSAICFAWMVLSPPILWGKKGWKRGLIMLSVLILPFLYGLSVQTRRAYVFSTGFKLAIASLVVVWGAAVLFRALRRRMEIPAALGVLLLVLTPVGPVLNLIVTNVFEWGFFEEIWSWISVCITLILAVDCFIWHYIRKRSRENNG